MTSESYQLDLLRHAAIHTANNAVDGWPWSMLENLAIETDILSDDFYVVIQDQVDEQPYG